MYGRGNPDLYGYGDFLGYDLTQQYRFTDFVGGVQCAVVEEQGYSPSFSTDDAATSFTMVQQTVYYYYARDIENNIHLLSTTLGWDYEDLPVGGTTLICPYSPEAGQQVFGGEVLDASGHLGDVSHSALIIDFNSLPYDSQGPLKQYILPDSGIYAISYNWDGGTNGFAQNTTAPEDEEDAGSNLEQWKDEPCFISACHH